ncbi:MAG TPA: alpha/beta fold hydrolase [Myxococcota bacterium]|nr:alpha/beta fold hydrolase [Myxococcota bacterium]
MRNDYDAAEVRKGLLRETAATLGHGLIYLFGFLPSRHRSERAKDIHTVVFVHGLAGNRAQFFPLQGFLRWRGYSRQYAYNYRSTASIEAKGLELKRHLDEHIKGGRITLVAHSMGGLVSRVYLQMLGGDRRVDTLITLGTPHLGSHAVAWMPTQLVSQLKPDGPFLSNLNSLPAPEGVRCVSFAGTEDLMVLPGTNALGFGEEILLEGAGHLDMLMSRQVFLRIGRILDAEEA